MDTVMRFLATILLMLLMAVFLGLGFTSIFQHFNKPQRAQVAAFEQLR